MHKETGLLDIVIWSIIVLSIPTNTASAQYDTLIYTMADGPNCVRATDIDGDGDQDLVVSSSYDDRLAWYENDGSGELVDHHIMQFTAVIPASVDIGDLDGDGDPDVAYSGQYGHVEWFANDGGGGFSSTNLLGYVSNGDEVRIADIDNDGDADVIAAGGTVDGQIALFQNQGAGIFSSAETLTDSFPTRALAVIDLNGDGLLDILGGAWLGGGVYWLQNQGAGDFSAPVLIDNLTGSVYLIGIDLDGDGDNDAVAGSDQFQGMRTYINNGSGTFTIGQSLLPGWLDARSLAAADLDNDSDEDIVVALFAGDRVVWLANNGSGVLGPEQVVSASAYGASSVTTADMNGDGTQDVISSSRSDCEVSWFANSGAGSFASETVLTTSVNHISTIELADLDSDGIDDLFTSTANDNKLAWHKGDATGALGPQIVIDDNKDGVGARLWDQDGDGDLDILVTSTPDSLIKVYLNNGGANFSATASTVAVGYAAAMYLGDVNGDGHTDIASVGGDGVVWFPGTGTGGFDPPQFIADNFGGASLSDLDGDGDIDIVIASPSDSSVTWYANDGTGTTWMTHPITNDIPFVNALWCQDVNGDGSIDVVTSSYTGGQSSAWFTNDGAGTFIGPNPIDPQYCRVHNAADMDADGDIDLLAAGGGFDGLLRFTNDGTGNFVRDVYPGVSSYPGLWFALPEDIDSDGLTGVLFGPSDAIFRIPDMNTGIDHDNEALDAMVLFPNPFSEVLRIELPFKAMFQYQITDLTGRLLLMHLGGIGDKLTWDGRTTSGTELPPGMYLLTVIADGQRYTQRVIKQ